MMKWKHRQAPAAANAGDPTATSQRSAGSNGVGAKSLDPYLRWAEVTEWRGVRRLMGASPGLGIGDESIQHVRVLVQAPIGLSQVGLWEALHDEHWAVGEVYKHWIPGTKRLARHFTAKLDREYLPWLKTNPYGVRWELALPFRDAETAARAVQVGGTGPTRAADSFRPANEKLFKVGRSEVTRNVIDKAIAVIDFGCPFLNTAFSANAQFTATRVAALWDQGSDVPQGMATPWFDITPRMGYGRELSQDAMNELLCEVRAGRPDAMDEAEAYRRIDYLIDYDDARRRIWGATHGSHVLDVAGGCIDPLTGKDDDAASGAPLIFVQLPSLTGADSAGGSLSAQVLDGVRYVLDVCTGDAQVVINLSYGSFAGPHDGSSLIEQALDELLKARRGSVALVLGAGNARQADCHLRRSVRENRSALLRLDVPPGDFTDTFVEVWFDASKPQHLKLLRARVRSGDGDWCPPIACGEQAEMVEFGERRRVAMLRMDEHVPNGDKPLLLLALAPTARPADDDGPLACTGPWEIELFLQPEPDYGQALDGVEIHFDAWVERDDPGWLGVGMQPRFTDVHFGDADESLSSLATGRYTFAVGGFRRDDGLPVAYSSTGSRLGPPVVYTACEESAQQPNVRAAGVRSADSLRMNGTSVAAPVFARRLYNWMASGNAVDPEQLQAAIDGVVKAQTAGDDLVRHAHPDERARFKRRSR